MKSGIYLISNNCNGKKYIGQSLNVKQRISRHKSELRYNKHHNLYLQREFNKYGEKCFEFTVLEYCSPDELDVKEVYLINNLKTIDYQNGYNMEGGGNLNKFISESTRLKKVGKNNAMYGKTISEDHKEIIRIANLGSSDKLTPDDVENIKISLINNETISNISKKYEVSISTVDKIAKVKNWIWIREDLNEKLLNMFDAKKKTTQTRNQQIKEMFSKGYSLNQIQEKTKSSKRVVNKILCENTNTLLEKRNANIVSDFKKGMTKKDIMIKYNISSVVYVSVTKNCYNEKVQAEKNKAIAMRLSGLSVKEISQQLDKHRTTITEWTKHIFQ